MLLVLFFFLQCVGTSIYAELASPAKIVDVKHVVSETENEVVPPPPADVYDEINNVREKTYEAYLRMVQLMLTHPQHDEVIDFTRKACSTEFNKYALSPYIAVMNSDQQIDSEGVVDNSKENLPEWIFLMWGLIVEHAKMAQDLKIRDSLVGRYPGHFEQKYHADELRYLDGFHEKNASEKVFGNMRNLQAALEEAAKKVTEMYGSHVLNGDWRPYFVKKLGFYPPHRSLRACMGYVLWPNMNAPRPTENVPKKDNAAAEADGKKLVAVPLVLRLYDNDHIAATLFRERSLQYAHQQPKLRSELCWVLRSDWPEIVSVIRATETSKMRRNLSALQEVESDVRKDMMDPKLPKEHVRGRLQNFALIIDVFKQMVKIDPTSPELRHMHPHLFAVISKKPTGVGSIFTNLFAMTSKKPSPADSVLANIQKECQNALRRLEKIG